MLDGNYMITSGRINVLTYNSGGEDPAEVDYSESPVPADTVQDELAEPEPENNNNEGEQEHEVSMEVTDNTTDNVDIPDTSPAEAPVVEHLITVDGVGYTLAQLSSILSAQAAEKTANLRKAGWGTLLPSRSAPTPVLTQAAAPKSAEEGVEKETVNNEEKMEQDDIPAPDTQPPSETTSPADKRTLILSLLHAPQEGATAASLSAPPADMADTTDVSPATEREPTAPPSPPDDSTPMATTGPAQTMFSTAQEDACLDETQDTVIQARDRLKEQQRTNRDWRQQTIRPKSAHSGPNTDANTSAVDDTASPPSAPASLIPEVWVDRE
ncbi:hypothetical protein B484DRAFT_471085, partial [Ochromonadaceae sp. CCMP2298]